MDTPEIPPQGMYYGCPHCDKSWPTFAESYNHQNAKIGRYGGIPACMPDEDPLADIREFMAYVQPTAKTAPNEVLQRFIEKGDGTFVKLTTTVYRLTGGSHAYEETKRFYFRWMARLYCFYTNSRTPCWGGVKCKAEIME